MIIGSLCHYLHIDGIVCDSTCPLTLGANTWGIFFCCKVVSLSFDSKLVRATSITNIDIYMEFIWHLPEILVFPSKMNVDLKFVFRSLVQVYQRHFNVHSYVSLIRWFCSSSWWGSLQVQILRDIWRKRWISICTTKIKAKLQGSGDTQGNSAWGPISASSSSDSLPLLHQGR